MDVHGTVTAQCSPNPMAAYYNSSFPGIFEHQYMMIYVFGVPKRCTSHVFMHP